jgi:hypothetical protein
MQSYQASALRPLPLTDRVRNVHGGHPPSPLLRGLRVPLRLVIRAPAEEDFARPGELRLTLLALLFAVGLRSPGRPVAIAQP